MSNHSWKRRAAARIWVVCVLLSLSGGFASATERVQHPEGWGLGLMLGEPIGLTAKYWLGGANAIDLGVGGGPGFRIHADYDWGLAQVLEKKTDLTLDLYLGVGGAVAFASGFCGYYGDRFCQDRVFGGVRVPFGLDFRLRRAPFNFGLELAPGMWFGSYVTGLFDVFLFGRFLF
jgi:hypothetical protein